MDILVKRIIDLRESKDWSQSELARRMGIDKSVMNKIENGTRKVSSEELSKLSSILNVTSDYLLGKNQTPEWAEKDEVIQLDKILQSKVGMAYGPDGEISEEDREALDNLIAGYFWSKKKKEKERND